LGLHFGEEGPGCFVEPQQLPADRLVAGAAACDLPDAHYVVALFGLSDCVDFDVACIAIVSKLKNVP
jgi:hypothetical protein